jgi:hypothetical protein
MAGKGRPTKFSQKTATRICNEIVAGNSLRHICEADDMPAPSTVLGWVADPRYKTFSEQYAHACEERTEAFIEEIFAIADDGSNDWMEKHYGDDDESTWVINGEAVQRSKLRVDARKWYASKMKPKRYGDKLDLTSDGDKLPQPIYANLKLPDGQ